MRPSDPIPVFLSLVLGAAVLAGPAAGAVDFSHEIAPLLRRHCAECHAGDQRKGGFSLNDRESLLQGSENGPVLEPGHPERSLLVELVGTEEADLRMPPEGPGLSSAEVETVRRWVAEGVPWEAGFAFREPAYEPPLRPRAVTLPPPSAPGRDHPVDRLVDAYFARKGVTPPPPAPDETFLRRVHLDLIGLLPAPEEVAAFRADAAPDKRIRKVRELLARDVDYAEHWLTFWNDLLRNDYGGTGFITGGRKQISAWLYEALVTNLPYDRFARELIAPSGDASRGFSDGIRWRGEVSAGQTVEIQFAQSVGQSFLGINLKCASCHDSFIDRWKLDEAYGLAAIYAENPLQIHRCDKPVGRAATPSWLFPELGQVDPAAPRAERLRQLADLMTHPENGRFPRTLVNRIWHRLLGHGIVHPLDAMQTEPWDADLLDALAHGFAADGHDVKRLLEHIATSAAYQARSETVSAPDEGEFVFRGPRARRLTAEQFLDAVWQLTGEAPVKFDAPVFRGRPDPAAAREVALSGQWIWGDASAGTPPPAGDAVLLRATWKLPSAPVSGAAILTCDNAFVLYVNGRKVAASEDWERIEAVPLHDKLQAGANQIVILARNAGNGPNAAGCYFQARVELADGSRADLVSDGSWEFSRNVPAGREGRLGALPTDLRPVAVLPALEVWQAALTRQGPALLAHGEAASGKMVRASLLKGDFLMRSLGRPNRDQIVSMRPEELTTLEAIDLSNGDVLASALARGADRLVGRFGADSRGLLDWIYLQALTRSPTDAEAAAALDVLGPAPASPAVADVLWAVLMQPEFFYVR